MAAQQKADDSPVVIGDSPDTPATVPDSGESSKAPTPKVDSSDTAPPPAAAAAAAAAALQQEALLVQQQSKYNQLLAVIEEVGKDIRPTYAGSKTSAERLKRGIIHARILVRECLMEVERSGRS